MASIFTPAARRLAGAAVVGAVAGGAAVHRWHQGKGQDVSHLNRDYRWRENVSAEDMHMAVSAAKAHGVAHEQLAGAYKKKRSKSFGAFVHAYEPKEYEKMDRELMEDADSLTIVAGVAVNEGDVVSVFKHPTEGPSGTASKVIDRAVTKHGGTHLDCFDSHLTKIYARKGFVPVAKIPFDPKEAPPDWNESRDGAPDVLFMVRDPKNPLVDPGTSKVPPDKRVKAHLATMEYSAGYDEAKAAQLERVRELSRKG